jgi:hypothetical protein
MLSGAYIGLVEINADPLKLGRLKVRVPHVYGSSSTGSGYIPVNDLPWALPAGMPAGGSSASGGISMLPVPGDQVMVQFLDGEPEKPVWTWLMQTQSQAKVLKLHHYGTNSAGEVTAPDRAILSRYGHSLELRAEGAVLTTKEGSQLLLQDSTSASGGKAAIQTPKGQQITLDDLGQVIKILGLDAVALSAITLILNAATSIMARASERFTLMAGPCLIVIEEGSIIVTTGNGASIVVDTDGNIAVTSADGASLSLDTKAQLGSPLGTGIVAENGKFSINAPQLIVNTASAAIGTAAKYPVMMLTPAMLTWILSHTHTNGNNGSPTGAPIGAPPLNTESLTLYTI